MNRYIYMPPRLRSTEFWTRRKNRSATRRNFGGYVGGFGAGGGRRRQQKHTEEVIK
jgi:hypothetical protein